MVIIVADSILWTNATRKMAPLEVLTTVEGEQYESICYHISNTYHNFQKKNRKVWRLFSSLHFSIDWFLDSDAKFLWKKRRPKKM